MSLSDGGNRPSERDYYSYYNTEQESTLKQMLGALCRVFWLRAWLYLSAQLFTWQSSCLLLFFPLLFSSLFPSPRFFFLPLHFPPTSPPPQLFEIKYLLSYINFDQSNALICLAGETVTYWGRFSYTQMKKARFPACISEYQGGDANFYPALYNRPVLFAEKPNIFPQKFSWLQWLIIHLYFEQMWERKKKEVIPGIRF